MSLYNQSEGDEMGGTCNTHEGNEKCIKDFIGKYERKRSFRGHQHK
jgi:hypothetical protein